MDIGTFNLKGSELNIQSIYREILHFVEGMISL